MILYGAPVREKIKEILVEKIKKLEKKPCLAIVQVGDREDSNVYIKNKIKFGKEMGVEVLLKKFETNIAEKDLIKEVDKLANDDSVDSIIVQLPIPKNINTNAILNKIPMGKDADGLSTTKSVNSDNIITPATARAVILLLDYYKIGLRGKKVAVIGQSILAGKPISFELEKRGAEVFRCDISTKNIPEITRECNILISAVGKPHLINKEFVNFKQVIIDVGINRVEGKLVGDVNFAEVEPVVCAITPVPGGIGPLTVACLFQNLLDLISEK
ncbi:MAG: hypothetical protein A2431_01705 [Candidatus Zambryskibacteria bacterium RIFOXYC1_FULL_39_10]|uniref:Bifunctional protein FolD n=1 Tax=Candidatus Zambryskibacteria bacterium RIFOXYC1_FULL_39_10 TaxID=1802779 RepID=A0A1G2V451_9BACT|nr:MAG: hypothetical protein A2605_03025 [Candidatus Zambryskibacteria bacterium RIFOXYD1_FULL_39_35]OHB16394.1 MAG: hypothetical protein A2431_01705 [Candidatus Zambryskibacteria bacterium RIFOXYC1_FULL_39_10]